MTSARVFKTAAIGSALVYALWARPSLAQERISETFLYEFHGTDIGPWTRGERTGPVPSMRGQTAKALDTLLARARKSVSIAIYGVQRQPWFFDRLSDLVLRGVSIAAVVDQERGAHGDWRSENFTYADTVMLPDLLGEDRVVPDLGPSGRPRTGSIMHNKFLVVDSSSVWLGSANVSDTCLGAEYNANSSLLVRSPRLAQIFEAEFEQMHKEKRFSANKQRTLAPRHLLYRDGTEIKVFFSPQDRPVDEAVLPFIRAARHRLDVGMFYLTDLRVANELIAAQERGVKVRVIYDALAAAHYSSKHKVLRLGGVDVRVENWGGKMHMKTAVADGHAVLIGSMNWSDSGNGTNDEHTVVITGNAKLADDVASYFAGLWGTLDSMVKAKGPVDPRAEGRDSINSCFDGIDNDYDGLVDEDDPSCL